MRVVARRADTELAANWPVITTRKDALPDAEQWRDVAGKGAALLGEKLKQEA